MTGGSNISALKTALAAAEARAANAEAKVSGAEAEIAFLKLTIEKLRREMYGWRSERKQRLLDQLELALEAVKRIDVLFDIERGINGKAAEQRRAVRQELSAPVLADLKGWMQAERRKLSRHSPVAKAMDYILRRWDLFARFLDDGRICLTNNAAERALRGIALGRKSWLFAGSDRGGVRAAAMYTLIGTAKLNNVNPQAWLADVLDRIAGTPQSQLDKLLPWNWQDSQRHDQAA